METSGLTGGDIVPLPFNCPKCGQLTQFQYTRTGDDRPEPYIILIYLCPQHGFFRYSRYHLMTEGM